MNSAPMVRPIPAQGNALGSGATTHQVLKGRPKRAAWRTGLARDWDAPSGLYLGLSRFDGQRWAAWHGVFS